MSDTVIVAALRRGNLRRAVELICDAYHGQVYGYCASLVCSAHALQVYQQALTTAMVELPTLDGVVSIRAWLFGVARRIVLRFQGQSAADQAPVPQPPKDDLPPALRPTDVELEQCLAALGAAEREVLQLTLWQGLLLSEVAHITGRTAGEVRRLATAGLSQLSGDLHRQGGAPS